MKKHAYLIMAYNNFDLLEKLILRLNDYRNDIFIHIDKKSNLENNFEKKIKDECKKSSIYFIDRINVYWGDFSQIQCELNLLKATAGVEKYEYYHLLSGSDYPIVSQDTIHNFFERNKGKEFIEIKPNLGKKFFDTRYNCYNFFVKGFKNKNKLISKLSKRLSQFLILIQWFLKVKRRKNETIKYGSNWFSITSNAVKLILKNEDVIKRKYKFTLCCDEIFLQTILYNSNLKNNISNKEYGNLRYIIWEPEINKNSPKILKKNDFEIIKKSNKFFARKFDKESIELIDILDKRN